ncbi:SNF5 / SMARCB1 / INI1 domain protein [Nitzschia inconspicua]|uniref:SNF5 / SMARCB1 / INI1 domain protein n=1 Tax=Nitzschia inconspicua TaxID=303405 RepID=A0A9K3L2F4_9STRA|nr:SNF5 / SMARCB1 / INI1 domain protein [Nitzschia inconspicua]
MTSSTKDDNSSTLIPVRIDVLTDDRLLRVVDTLLIDPTCWPISLCAPIHETVERNVTHLAHTILSDAEVQGMSRTARHFSGRVDIWTPQLQEKVEEQLRPQLWKIVNGQATIANEKDSTLLPISIRFIMNRIVVHEDILWDVHGPVTPIEFAQEMAKEFKLPDEAVVSIVTTMLEQIYGLAMDESSNPAVDEKLEEDMRGAWMLDAATTKAHTESHVAAQQKTS